ncbi:MAG: hypothetical protein KDD33_07545 [Bdellovibrionales bacterium]|nr:hypothetical protein [Bdellovibrionales bacterium]
MRKLDYIIAFFTLGISTMVLFQNCGAPRAVQEKSVTFSNNGQSINTDQNNDDNPDPIVVPEPEPEPEPVVLMNRNIALDNEVKSGEVSFDSATDTFMYETNYLASSASTLVKINGSEAGVEIEVQADSCSASRSMSFDDLTQFFNLFSAAYPNTQQRVVLESDMLAEGCSFPRVIMDANDPTMGDLEIFLAPKECVADGELFVVDSEDKTAAQMSLEFEAFFKAQIDMVCGL